MSTDKKKDCETCMRLRSPKSFSKGTNIRLPELENCEECEVTLSQPLPENEIILEMYADIPCYDSMAGLKTFSISDITNLFRLHSIPEVLHEECFNKIVFFHQEYMVGRAEARDKEEKTKKNKIASAKKFAQTQKDKKSNPVKIKKTRG